MTSKTRIVRIGNSRGIRVPKLLLEHAGLQDEVELHAELGRIVVTSGSRARANWAAKAREMHHRSDDVLVDATTPTRFDESDWRW
jgi:antitoxin MazE